MAVELTVGATYIDRVIANADGLLRKYRHDTVAGSLYLDYESTTIPKTIVVPEDLAVTLLVNSRVSGPAFRSLYENGATIIADLARLPSKPLEQTTADERRQLAALIAKMATWPGFGASVATKVLHKKRPDLIPILDNQAIFGAYMNMNRDWPEKPAKGAPVKSAETIFPALDWIAFDITRPENELAWESLQSIEPSRTRIQLFDSVWWTYFKCRNPVP